jgi:hypothetical protein
MAGWMFRAQIQAARTSPSTENVAVIDMSWAFCTGSSQSAFAALGHVNNGTAGMGVPVGTDYTALGNALDTFLNSLRGLSSSSLTWNYMTLHNLNTGHPVPNPSVFNRTFARVGNGGVDTLPPQDSIAITLVTIDRRHWGRFYIPQISTSYQDTNGRITSSGTSLPITYLRTLYGTAAAANWYPIVIDSTVGDSARPVQSLRGDNVFDIQRRRRYARSTLTNTGAIP